MPILINETDVVVLSISSSLLDAMATLNQTTFAELAIVSMPINAQKNTKISELLIRSPISVANKRFMQHILQQVPAELSVATLKQFGFRLTTPTTDLLLNLLPVEVIKIDRSFVSGMQDDNADMKNVSSTIAMVNKLGMMVVAEGIETAEQMKMLTDMQCDIGQGYFISKPVNEKDLYALLPTKVSHGIWTNISLTDD
jgi:predicted signal transduction protein with EAL and GGDEF domain